MTCDLWNGIPKITLPSSLYKISELILSTNKMDMLWIAGIILLMVVIIVLVFSRKPTTVPPRQMFVQTSTTADLFDPLEPMHHLDSGDRLLLSHTTANGNFRHTGSLPVSPNTVSGTLARPAPNSSYSRNIGGVVPTSTNYRDKHLFDTYGRPIQAHPVRNVAVIYDKSSSVAERSPDVTRVVPLILEELRIQDKLRVEYISHDDIQGLRDMYSRGVNIYISHLGSPDALVLYEEFFRHAPNAIHLTSYPSATSLAGKSLLRLYPPDIITARLFSDMIEGYSDSFSIVYNPDSIWSRGLAEDIVRTTGAEGNLIDINNPNWIDILASTSKTRTIVFLTAIDVEERLSLIRDRVKGKYRLLFGDANADIELPSLSSFLTQRNARLIQPFISDIDVEEIERVSRVTGTNISSQYGLFKALFDVALGYTPSKRTYGILNLDENFDNVDGSYAIMYYVGGIPTILESSRVSGDVVY